ncbi:MAG: NUDIX domain-containing protein [Dehalococcoidia bacterium]|nr:NUDIX domain-containing protein [Dehalococcoidia bacterium]
MLPVLRLAPRGVEAGAGGDPGDADGMTDPEGLAREGEAYEFRDERSQDWLLSWHSPELPPPEGTRHGSDGICFTPDGSVVLVTQQGTAWEYPGGRPEGDEEWRATLVREVLEEACAVVRSATLLGYSRSVCLKGEEAGLVLVRALWCADVGLKPWRPQHETTGRMVVHPEEVLGRVRNTCEPIDRRAFHEALVARGLA